MKPVFNVNFLILFNHLNFLLMTVIGLYTVNKLNCALSAFLIALATGMAGVKNKGQD